MDATEVCEIIEGANGEAGGSGNGHEAESRARTFTAIYIAILAAVLAVVSVTGSNIAKSLLTNSIESSDQYAFYQAKTQRMLMFRLSAESLEATMGFLPEDGRAVARERVAEYRRSADRLENEEKDGRKAILARAKMAENLRDLAAAQDPYYDFAEALLQIAIVLASVFAITERRFLLWISRALALTAIGLAIDGYWMLIPLPFL
jgi:hypothetical protein